jgi:hypothetical protein
MKIHIKLANFSGRTYNVSVCIQQLHTHTKKKKPYINKCGKMSSSLEHTHFEDMFSATLNNFTVQLFQIKIYCRKPKKTLNFTVI